MFLFDMENKENDSRIHNVVEEKLKNTRNVTKIDLEIQSQKSIPNKKLSRNWTERMEYRSNCDRQVNQTCKTTMETLEEKRITKRIIYSEQSHTQEQQHDVANVPLESLAASLSPQVEGLQESEKEKSVIIDTCECYSGNTCNSVNVCGQSPEMDGQTCQCEKDDRTAMQLLKQENERLQAKVQLLETRNAKLVDDLTALQHHHHQICARHQAKVAQLERENQLFSVTTAKKKKKKICIRIVIAFAYYSYEKERELWNDQCNEFEGMLETLTNKCDFDSNTEMIEPSNAEKQNLQREEDDIFLHASLSEGKGFVFSISILGLLDMLVSFFLYVHSWNTHIDLEALINQVFQGQMVKWEEKNCSVHHEVIQEGEDSDEMYLRTFLYTQSIFYQMQTNLAFSTMQIEVSLEQRSTVEKKSVFLRTYSENKNESKNNSQMPKKRVSMIEEKSTSLFHRNLQFEI
ncbi:hypothetical protein RFI_07406 [Reticulomyxa filosa]|uniref:Uncharacterized protein n=1 Tax=Reticulomyxa filosa TaxID=46433 RepID=X6NWP5_RETFI|nr:hypothetical protein RFI_07406 [Reticulomyxa filosa]|eukprot:ETO29712.1 hypothetical protein RFI_07406 [Reticulomyxa filosa]